MKKRYLAMLPILGALSLTVLASCGSDISVNAEDVTIEKISTDGATKLTSETEYKAAVEALAAKKKTLLDANCTETISDEDLKAGKKETTFKVSDYTLKNTRVEISNYAQSGTTTTTKKINVGNYDDENKAMNGEADEIVIRENANAGKVINEEKLSEVVCYDNGFWYDFNLLTNEYISMQGVYTSKSITDSETGISTPYFYYSACPVYGAENWIVQDDLTPDIDKLENYYEENTENSTYEYYYDAANGILTMNGVHTSTSESGTSTENQALQYTVNDSGMKLIVTYSYSNSKAGSVINTTDICHYSEITFTDTTVKTYDYHDFNKSDAYYFY